MTRDEVLVILIEECAEVIQAATKCLRFGFERDWPDYGINSEVLAKELGDLLGASDALALNQDIVSQYRRQKMPNAEKWKKYMQEHPVALDKKDPGM